MPCRDWGSEGVQYVENPINKQMKEKLDNTTRLLCSVMTQLECRNKIMGDPAINFDSIKGLNEWWERHKEEDRQEELRKKALEKKREVARQREIDDLEKRLSELKRKAK